MYKKQLAVQKIICFAALAVSALVFLYSLGLMTDLYDSLYFTMMDASNPDDTWVPGSQIYYHMQPFNKQLLVYAIGMSLVACLLFITSTHARRRYYVGNLVSTAAFVGTGTALSIWSHIELDAFKAEFLQIDFESLQFFAEIPWNFLPFTLHAESTPKRTFFSSRAMCLSTLNFHGYSTATQCSAN